MTPNLLASLAVLAYLVGGYAFYRYLRQGANAQAWRRLATVATTLGLVPHGLLLAAVILSPDGLRLGLAPALALAAWGVVASFAIAVTFRPAEALGPIILMAAALLVPLPALTPPASPIPLVAGPWQGAHIILSILAYSLLAVAAIQSVLLALQESRLHSHHPGRLLRALPPLDIMEDFMFRMIYVGFGLLSVTLISGFLFAEQVFGQPLRLTHHIVLTLIGWVVFAVLIGGRLRRGWRGQQAARMSLIGFSLLVLGYFGSKFVLEVLLQRG